MNCNKCGVCEECIRRLKIEFDKRITVNSIEVPFSEDCPSITFTFKVLDDFTIVCVPTINGDVLGLRHIKKGAPTGELLGHLENDAFDGWCEANSIVPRYKRLRPDMVNALGMGGRGHTNVSIQNMASDTMLREILEWNGIIGYTQSILTWVDYSRNIEGFFLKPAGDLK